MAKSSPRRTRRVNVAVSVDWQEFVHRLARVSGWHGDVTSSLTSDGGLKPGECGEGGGDSAGRFSVNYLWREFLSKYDDGKSSEEKKRVSLQKFAEAETICAEVNSRLEFAYGDPSRLRLASSFDERAMVLARRIVRYTLGRYDDAAAARGCVFTTGASTRLPRRLASGPHKYSGKPETTSDNFGRALHRIGEVPTWHSSLLTEGGTVDLCRVDGNKVVTVPKNYKTDRTIAIEPCMNMYVQKGIASVIRRRLRRQGVDLSSQELNQRYAKVGSIADSLATIDLSMASDTISRALVRILLPSDWHEALEQSRSWFGVLPCGSKTLYRKFSSMGNGYTFELETLLFWSLAQAVAILTGTEDRRITCYGDDIIVPSVMASELICLLETVGFRVNEKKTFVRGPFRESCGKHYFAGHDVTPFYIRNDVKTLSDLFILHNKLRRWLNRQYPWNAEINWKEGQWLLAWLRSHAPSDWRKPRIPDGFGDGAFMGTFEEAVPTRASSKKKFSGWEGFACRVMADVPISADQYEQGWGIMSPEEFKPLSDAPDPVGLLLYRLSIIGSESEDGGIPVAVRKRLIDIVVPQFVLDF